mmetsp:Transcript_94844/g.267790  ORF Transcript_94844/g.267790 Transcript_94844/m.267790 type:complete len:219 (+) Transcript_94844:1006-1662(+)
MAVGGPSISRMKMARSFKHIFSKCSESLPVVLAKRLCLTALTTRRRISGPKVRKWSQCSCGSTSGSSAWSANAFKSEAPNSSSSGRPSARLVLRQNCKHRMSHAPLSSIRLKSTSPGLKNSLTTANWTGTVHLQSSCSFPSRLLWSSSVRRRLAAALSRSFCAAGATRFGEASDALAPASVQTEGCPAQTELTVDAAGHVGASNASTGASVDAVANAP